VYKYKYDIYQITMIMIICNVTIVIIVYLTWKQIKFHSDYSSPS